jgi:FSR family fosmidomycin resistance protein-like MFS transporter
MSMFMFGGEISRTFGPLLITGAIAWLTLEGSAIVMVFGLAASVILYFTLDTSASDAAERAKTPIPLRPLIRARRRYLVGLFGFGAVVNIYTAPFSFYLVKLLLDKGHSELYAGFALSLFFAAGGIGGVLGGSLSDLFGRRVVLISTAICTAPLLYLFLLIEDQTVAGLIVLCIGAVIAMANRPIQLALGQDIMPEARGPMSGMMLAFGFVSMSMIAMIFSALADQVGLETVFWFTPVAALLTLPFILLLPRRGERLPDPVLA